MINRFIIYIPDGFDEGIDDETGDELMLSDSSNAEGRRLHMETTINPRMVDQRTEFLVFDEAGVRRIRDLLTEWLDAPAADAQVES